MTRVALLTREYPPEVYGGAGVHVEYLARELSRIVDVDVHCWGEPRGPASPAVIAHPLPQKLAPATALQATAISAGMAAAVASCDIAHSHTWYANLAGHLAMLQHGIPHVATVHSLEPMRPWKAEQLGGGYGVSSFIERTALLAASAVVAVSGEMRADILASYPEIDADRVVVIGNGIDTTEYAPDAGTDVLDRHGIDPARPSVVFVGRITRQKGLAHLLAAAPAIDPDAQIVLCAGAPDTPEIAAETAATVASLSAARSGVVWIDRMLAKVEVIQILSHCSVFVCPSIYEPLGIVNLEAMACGAPVVATATGGIPEVVDDGTTGLLVPFEHIADASRAPVDPARFAADIAERVNALLADPSRARAMGAAGRARAVEHFGWDVVARRIADLYGRLLT